MAKKPKIPEHENAERWMVSYADFMTLLFALFVVLYGFAMSAAGSASSVAEGLMESFSQMGLITNKASNASDNALMFNPLNDHAVSTAAAMTNPQLIHSDARGGGGMLEFGNPKSSNSVSDNRSSVNKEKEKVDEGSTGSDVSESIADSMGENQMGAPLDSLYDDISQALEDMKAEGSVAMTKDNNWLTIEIKDAVVFAPNSASILNGAKPILAKISDIIYPISNYIRVRGYTDNAEVHDEIYDSNWDLSAARAISVVKRFIADDIDPRRLAIEAYAQWSPFVSNSTERGRAKNRCVSIAISKYAMVHRTLEVLSDEDKPIKGNAIDLPDLNDPITLSGAESLEIMRLPDGKVQIFTGDKK